MKHVKIGWVIVLVLLVVPYVALFTAGMTWLCERHLLLWWLAGGGVLTFAGWGLARWLRAKRTSPIAPAVEPAPTWPPAGHAAWSDVEALAKRVEGEDVPLDRPEALRAILLDVLETVARHYHPKAKQAPWRSLRLTCCAWWRWSLTTCARRSPSICLGRTCSRSAISSA